MSQDRRARILEAAARLFADSGFDATSVRDVAAAADSQPGSVFYHFDSKRDLLVEVVREGSVRAQAIVDVRLDGVEDPRARLHELVRGHLEALLGESRAFTVVANDWLARLSDEEAASVVEARDAYEQRWRQVLAEAADAGVVGDVPALRWLLLGATNMTVLWYREGVGLSLDDLCERFLAFVETPSPVG